MSGSIHKTIRGTFRIITLGCKVNQFESAWFREALLKEGFLEAEEGRPCEVAVINTCTVTSKAAQQSRQAIRRALRENPGAVVAAVGCHVQVYPEEMDGIPGVGLVAGNVDKGQVIQRVLEILDSTRPQRFVAPFPETPLFEELPVAGFGPRTRGLLKIQDGCEAGCTYCIVPRARGGYRSLAPEKALRALEGLAREGFREIVLTGIHLGKYGVDLGKQAGLVSLLRRIGKEGFPFRIRLSSLEPQEITPELVDLLGTEPWLCPHLHVPLQSGDNAILRRMRRPYRREEFVRIIRSVHQRVPLAGLGVDVMTGFPGEDERAFQNTYDLLEDLPLSYFHVFPFSPREGTPAAEMKGTPGPSIVKQRAKILRELGRRKRRETLERNRGRVLTVLAEGWEPGGPAKGLSENYLPVLFEAPRDVTGSLIQVVSLGQEGLCLRARTLKMDVAPFRDPPSGSPSRPGLRHLGSGPSPG